VIRRIAARPGLALFSVFALVGLLFLSTALLDLRRTEAALLDLEKARAETLAEAAQAKAEELLERTLAGEDATIEFGFGRDRTTYDVLAAGLLAVGRRMTSEVDAGARRELAEAEELAGVSVLTTDGPDTVDGALPHNVRKQLEPLLEGRAEVALDLFGSGRGAQASRFVAVADRESKRIWVLLLDEEGFRRRALQVALQAAAEGTASHRDVAYFAVEDGSGRLLARAGPAPERSVSQDRQPVDGFAGDAEDPLEVRVPFQLQADEVGSARVGLRAAAARDILSRHRVRIAVTSSLLMGIGLFAVGLLYWVQRRHHGDVEELQGRLSRAERLSSLGRLGAALAHEIRNPLNALALGLQRLQREFLPPEEDAKETFRGITGIMRDETRRLNALVEEFLSASPESRGSMSPLSARDVVAETLLLVEEEARARHIRLDSRLPSAPCPILGDRDKLRQALLNLLRNALEAIPTEGRVEVAIDIPEPQRLRIRIRDDGVGIPAEHAERVFDPDFTTKEKGLGLGLVIAHEIIRAHGGEIAVSSRVGRGTSVDVWLPLAEQEIR
jgi:signal transduction histidine kinase